MTYMHTNPHNILKRLEKMGFEKPTSSKTYFVGENKRIVLFI